MILEKTMIINGALRSPAYKEVDAVLAKNKDSETVYKNSLVGEDYEHRINNDVLVSQLTRIVSLLVKTADLSSITQAQQDGILAQVNVFETYPMMGDQMLATDGMSRLVDGFKLQKEYANNYAAVTNVPVVVDAYAGLEKSAVTSSIGSSQRRILINKLVEQSTTSLTDYDAVDKVGMGIFITDGTKHIMVGTYTNMPNGNEVYTSLGFPTSPIQDAGAIITAHMAAGTHFDTDTQTFVV